MIPQVCTLTLNGRFSCSATFVQGRDDLLVSNGEQCLRIDLGSRHVSTIRNEDCVEYRDRRQRVSVSIPISISLPIQGGRTPMDLSFSFTARGGELYANTVPARTAFQLMAK
ncbi:hypothetical protein SS50377_23073 [Spironucleus salmonicida]|uniref:Uncharacterized protein n=1 Tax=Spironucleus salmonicida TaxID=348837 RepID=V6LSQ9_9EUKA|nr:hypothetical protein SS50377_23068 [Spironucleus salmonicida]KAH0575440.1 hypothetical protein SS50377_23073 [Spironucleus salmonicida]|eukprot:EST47644.1 Hypothetical protein SS50377_12339 [Spironucleus salmonicida]